MAEHTKRSAVRTRTNIATWPAVLKGMNKPTNTTAEANLGVRAIIPVGSGVLLAIAGHVLASVLPKLGVGNQLFNDL
ncbi:hypothetical protein GPALN_006863 [Globodera pallida]|nr:hypothetical protein GPALN_006863 [Globodera pallida]